MQQNQSQISQASDSNSISQSSSESSVENNNQNQQQEPQREIVQIDYEFLTFDQNQNQICYVDELFKGKNNKVAISNLEKLDLLELSEILILDDKQGTQFQKANQKNQSIEQITRNQLKLIQKFGTVELPSKISKKTGLYGKTDDEGNQNLANFYDTNDPFIDDELIDDGLKDFDTFESNFEDYNCCYGNLQQLLKSEHYQKRIQELKQIRTFKQEENQIYIDHNNKNFNQKQEKQNKKKKQQNQQSKTTNQSKDNSNNNDKASQFQKLLSMSPESNVKKSQEFKNFQQNENHNKPKNTQKNITISIKKISKNSNYDKELEDQKKLTNSFLQQQNQENHNSNNILQDIKQDKLNFEILKKKRKKNNVDQNQQQKDESYTSQAVSTNSIKAFQQGEIFKIIKF